MDSLRKMIENSIIYNPLNQDENWHKIIPPLRIKIWDEFLIQFDAPIMEQLECDLGDR